MWVLTNKRVEIETVGWLVKEGESRIETGSSEDLYTVMLNKLERAHEIIDLIEGKDTRSALLVGDVRQPQAEGSLSLTHSDRPQIITVIESVPDDLKTLFNARAYSLPTDHAQTRKDEHKETRGGLHDFIKELEPFLSIVAIKTELEKRCESRNAVKRVLEIIVKMSGDMSKGRFSRSSRVMQRIRFLC